MKFEQKMVLEKYMYFAGYIFAFLLFTLVLFAMLSLLNQGFIFEYYIYVFIFVFCLVLASKNLGKVLK